MSKLQKKIPAFLGLIALAALTACSASKSVMEPVDSMRGMKAATQQRLSAAAVDAIAAGKTEEAVALHAKLHKQHPKDRAIALAYAQLLRKTGKPAQAVKVLTPLASFKSRNNDSNPVTIYTSNAVILNELAAAHIATGNFAEAEKLLAHVLEDPSAAPLHADADSLMGIVMDARGDHRAAEQSFNRALAGWKGDPTPVMNNLALCLAAQGKFDDALDTLRRALVNSPNDKQEIARNIALISDLRGAVVSKPVAVAKVVKPAVKKTKAHKKPAACPPCPVPAQPEKPK
ncbi:MAG: tetratricopeptide repeat protein [Alphaproteobacteria bacterium]|nr:MAG: tetratricopeptide repeat protein [Alphaproteobacteria bacterium]